MTLYESINVPLWRSLRSLRRKRILDVGCGTGALGELLHQQGNYVEGVTFSHDEAAISSQRLDKVHVFDLNHTDQIDEYVCGEFDVVLFADVLEHLTDPLKTLRTMLGYLRQDGHCYISLPNVACFYVRFGLLLGRFEMQEEGGVLDATHLHFYTRKSASRMIQSAGLAIDRIAHVPAPSVWAYQFFKPRTSSASGRPARMSETPLFRFYERWLYPVERVAVAVWPGMLANQFVFACRPASASVQSPSADELQTPPSIDLPTIDHSVKNEVAHAHTD